MYSDLLSYMKSPDKFGRCQRFLNIPAYLFPHPLHVLLCLHSISSNYCVMDVMCRSSSNPDMHTVGDEDEEVNALARGLDRTCSMRTGTVCAI
jgi:hypothetical protein